MKPLIRTLVVLAAIMLHFAVSAQTSVDVVYLKNGSIIRGTIIEQVPNASLKIKTSDGSVFVYAISEVEKITKEEVSAGVRGSGQRISKEFQYMRSGFVNITSLAIGLGVGNYRGTVNGSLQFGGIRNSDKYIRLETVNGAWLANGAISIGLGLGLEYYIESTSSYNTSTSTSSNGQLPIFLDIRAIPLQGKASPSIIVQAGYSVGVIPAKMDYYPIADRAIFMNGFEFASGIGLHAEVSDNVAFNFSVLYDYQQLVYNVTLDPYYYGVSTQNHDVRFGTLRIALGLTF